MRMLPLLLILTSLSARPDEYFVLKARNGAGLFSMFGDVLMLCHLHQTHQIGGFEVNFGEEGVYYSEEEGPNWWEYCCKPLKIGQGTPIVADIEGINEPIDRQFWAKRSEAWLLIKSYIRIQPEITRKVRTFTKRKFTSPLTIGVHYRGTDWAPENNFRSIPFEEFADAVRETAHERGVEDFQVFIATDEACFITYMENVFPGKILIQEGIHRAEGDTPLHKDPEINPAIQAKEALIDCLLLAETDAFIGTGSNLSQWVLLFNYSIPMKDLSHQLDWINR